MRVRGSICSNFGETLQQAALLGHGISMHPYYMVSHDLATGRLQAVLPQHPPLSLDIYVIFSRLERPPPGQPKRVRHSAGAVCESTWRGAPGRTCAS